MCRCGGAVTVVRSAVGARREPMPQNAHATVHDIAMKYLGHTALLLKGPVSRRVYALTPGRPEVQIDPRDAEALSASRLFDRATP